MLRAGSSSILLGASILASSWGIHSLRASLGHDRHRERPVRAVLPGYSRASAGPKGSSCRQWLWERAGEKKPAEARWPEGSPGGLPWAGTRGKGPSGSPRPRAAAPPGGRGEHWAERRRRAPVPHRRRLAAAAQPRNPGGGSGRARPQPARRTARLREDKAGPPLLGVSSGRDTVRSMNPPC